MTSGEPPRIRGVFSYAWLTKPGDYTHHPQGSVPAHSGRRQKAALVELAKIASPICPLAHAPSVGVADMSNMYVVPGQSIPIHSGLELQA